MTFPKILNFYRFEKKNLKIRENIYWSTLWDPKKLNSWFEIRRLVNHPNWQEKTFSKLREKSSSNDENKAFQKLRVPARILSTIMITCSSEKIFNPMRYASIIYYGAYISNETQFSTEISIFSEDSVKTLFVQINSTENIINVYKII